MSREICFVEVPGFYAEVERRDDVALAGRPVLVGGDPRKGGSVQSANAAAREAGVVSGMSMVDALARCPRAKALRTRLPRYRRVSAELEACLRERVGAIEPAGLSAAFLEVEASDPEAFALALVDAVATELGLPLRVGVASVKFLARLAAEEAPVGACRRVAPGDEAGFLDVLPVQRLPGVGPATTERLAKLGVRTIGEFARLERAEVDGALGNHGVGSWQLAQGRDPASVRPVRHRKTLSLESSFDSDELDRSAILTKLESLCVRLEERLALERLAARRVTLKLRYADQEVVTRTRTSGSPLRRAEEMLEGLRALLDRTQAGSRPARSIGVLLQNLGPVAIEDRQMSLFPPTDLSR